MSVKSRSSKVSGTPGEKVATRKYGKAQRSFVSASDTPYHVISRGSRWIVKRGGALRAVGIYDTKYEAIEKAEQIMQSGKGNIIYIHDKDGKVQEKRSYGTYA